MGTIIFINNALYNTNNLFGRIGRSFAMYAMVLMVFIILLQVFCRYILNNALPWPDEAARFLMLWMTGLLAPVVYREGGFVAIDFIEQFLPKKITHILALLLLSLSFIVLVYAISLGYNHVKSGMLFNSSSLKIPLNWLGYKAVKVKLAWMYLSLFLGVILLTLANIELILRNIIDLTGKGEKLTIIVNREAGAS